MAQKKCPACGNKVAKDRVTCTCGHRFPKDEVSSTGTGGSGDMVLEGLGGSKVSISSGDLQRKSTDDLSLRKKERSLDQKEGQLHEYERSVKAREAQFATWEESLKQKEEDIA